MSDSPKSKQKKKTKKRASNKVKSSKKGTQELLTSEEASTIITKAFEYEYTQEDLEKVKTLASYGMTNAHIGLIMGDSRSTMDRRIRHRPEVADAIEKGKAEAAALMTQKAFQMAISGENPAFTMFWLKTRLGWREKQHIEVSHGISDKPIEDMSRNERIEKIEKGYNTLKKLLNRDKEQKIKDVSPNVITKGVDRGE